MDAFIEQQLAQTIRTSLCRAQALFDRGDAAAGYAICSQILERDRTTPGPWVLALRHTLAAGDFANAVEQGLMALRTRPQFETSGAFDSGLDVTYADIARDLIRGCDGLERTEGDGRSALALMARGLAYHVLGDFDSARTSYMKVLVHGADAARMVGECINLLHALEHQAGRPEQARRWLDLTTFPHAVHASDVLPDGRFLEFCDALYDEVMASPRLKESTDPQSRAWIVADDINRDGCGPRVKELEGIFDGLLARHRNLFECLDHDFVHDIFKTFPERHTYKMFCAILNGQGHVGPHIHNDGYLVGSLYVRVPHEPGEAEDSRAAINHGKHLFHAATGTDYPTRQTVPETGTILFWPAYYSHSVPPSRAETPRMAVGFEVVPA